MLFGERLKSLRKSKNLTQVDLASILELDKSSIAKYETLKAIPSLDILMKLAKYFNVSVDYMLGNEASVILSESTGTLKIPVYKTISSYPVESNWEIEGYEEITPQISEQGKCFAMRINDSSMEPRIWKGDTAIAIECNKARNGDVVILLIPGRSAICRKYTSQSFGAALISLNPAFEPILVSETNSDEAFKILGRVIEVRAIL
ncbi:LexA repressor [bioreactor metagenome]|uniref:LexA repressor n=1 Tax=bioreactor metagenome TaxID=1076179 RepID=A0A645F6E3_9ZZZZ|nr:XRE family transcriptional regulator [Lachnospiraceae bacterium]